MKYQPGIQAKLECMLASKDLACEALIRTKFPSNEGHEVVAKRR
jgi:hypothetical protein